MLIDLAVIIKKLYHGQTSVDTLTDLAVIIRKLYRGQTTEIC